jgi:MFS family permease
MKRVRTTWLAEPWFAPFALVNGSAVGLVPILLPLVSVRYGVGHVGLVMGAFNLGAVGAPPTGALADRFRAHRVLAVACAAISALSLWLFPLAGPVPQLFLALADGAGFAGAVTVANLLIVEPPGSRMEHPPGLARDDPERRPGLCAAAGRVAVHA